MGTRVVAVAVLLGTAWLTLQVRRRWQMMGRLKKQLAGWRAREAWVDICEQFGVTLAGGFLPDSCASRLEAEELQAWEGLIDELPELNRRRRLVAAIEAMPKCSTRSLTDERQLRRAYIVLCHLLHSFVNSSKVPWGNLADHGHPSASAAPGEASVRSDCGDNMNESEPCRVPAQLAVPLWDICAQLGLPPVLTAAVDLWNWRRLGPSGSGTIVLTVDDVQVLSSMTGTDTEAYFHLIPCAIQAQLGPIVLPIFLAPEALIYPTVSLLAQNQVWEEGSDVLKAVEEIGALLQAVREAIEASTELLKRIHQLVDKEEFYNMYRPLLGGFYPHGVFLEGVGREQFDLPWLHGSQACDGALRVCPKGPSAGQSAAFMLLDLFLGIRHKADAKKFQDEMADKYLPRNHRKMVQRYRDIVATHGSAATAASACGCDQSVAAARVCREYDACLDAMALFRKMHYGIALSYLSSTSTGTGASSFASMLRSFAADTQAARPVRSKTK